MYTKSQYTMKHALLLFLSLAAAVTLGRAQSSPQYAYRKPHILVNRAAANHGFLAVVGSEGRCEKPRLDYFGPDSGLRWSVLLPPDSLLEGFAQFTAVSFTPEGHIIAAGKWVVADDFPADPSFILMKTDTSGQILWARRYPNTEFYDVAATVFPDGRIALVNAGHMLLTNADGDPLLELADPFIGGVPCVLNDQTLGLAIEDSPYLTQIDLSTGAINTRTAGGYIVPQTPVPLGEQLLFRINSQWIVYDPVLQTFNPLSPAPAANGIRLRLVDGLIHYLKPVGNSASYTTETFNPADGSITINGVLNIGGRNLTDWAPDDTGHWVVGRLELNDPIFQSSYIARGLPGELALNATSDAGIEALSLNIISIDTIKPPLAGSSAAVFVNAEATFSIRNYGDNPIYFVAVASNQRGAFNCSEGRDTFYFDFPDGLASGEALTFTRNVSDWGYQSSNGSLFMIGGPYCLFTFAPNLEIDPNISNNQDCALFVSAAEPAPAPLGIQISPNPGSHELFVRHSYAALHVQLFDATGRLILSQLAAPNEPIPTSALPPGLYHCRFSLPDGRWESLRWVKQ